MGGPPWNLCCLASPPLAAAHRLSPPLSLLLRCCREPLCVRARAAGNHTMFEGTDGTFAALHVGQRTYPDGGKHLEILKANGASADDIKRLTSLPSGFSRGNVVAVLKLGATRLSTLEPMLNKFFLLFKFNSRLDDLL